MASRFQLRALLPLLALSAAGGGVCTAQRYVPPPPPLTVDPCAVQPNPKVPVSPDPKAKAPVCPPPAAPAAPAPNDGKPAAAEQFPFPGEAGSETPNAPAPSTSSPGTKPSAGDQFPYPGSAAPNAPAQTPPTAGKSASDAGKSADQFPYPGETSKSPDAVPEGDTPRYVPDSPAPGGKGTVPSSNAGDDSSSSGSSSSSSSSGDALPTPADTHDDAAAPTGGGDTKAAKGRRSLPKVSAQSVDERVTEDLSVAKFYSGRGNFEAAYLRSKDATKIMPNDSESHFALAQAAQKLQKKDEAVAEYTRYLELDPAGDKTAAAQKALSELR